MSTLNEDDDDKDTPAGVEGVDDQDDGLEEVFIPDEEDDDKGGKTKEVKGAVDDDERLGADPDAESPEQRRERRREERKKKKSRKREFETRDRLELNFLRDQNEKLERRLGAVEQGQRKQGTRVTLAQIDGAISQLQGKIAEADEVIAAAVTAGDGSEVAEANRIRDEIRDKMADLRSMRRDHVAREKAGSEGEEGGEEDDRPARTGAKPQNEIREVVRRNAQTFKSRHDWFDGKSSDSLIVMGLDAAIRAEGGNPASADFWQKLEERMKEAVPHRFEDSDDDDDDDDLDDDKPAKDKGGKKPLNASAGGKPNGKGPKMPAPGGSGRGPGKVYRISKERVDAMKEAGVWDDTKLRARMIKRYAAFDRENG